MLLPLTLAAAMGAAHPIAETKSGLLAGTLEEDGSVRFRGVPFAKPPIGAMRWRPPQSPERWSGVRDASKPAPACPQSDYGWNKADVDHGMSEDCLYLEVRTPSLTPKTRLPVMVWVHGGNATAGRGSWWADGAFHREGVVLVPVQYRLGALGWMAHPALSREQSGSSGNYGLMDLQAALRWVRRNIAAFGGDPNNVTLAGSSAGAQLVHLAMQSEESGSLFQRAILQSGSSNFAYSTRMLGAGERQGSLIAAAAGLPSDADATELRELSVEALLRAQETAAVPDQPDKYGMFLAPLVDGRVLTADPSKLLAADRTASVPLIVGNSAKEEAIYADVAAARAGIKAYFGNNADVALQMYGLHQGKVPPTAPRLGEASMQAATDIVYRCATARISQSAARGGLPVWQYQFDHGNEITHTSELGPLFGYGAEAPLAPIRRYWANFAKTGNPNGPGLPTWRRYDLDQHAYLEFSSSGPISRSRLRQPICNLYVGPPTG